VPTPSLTPDEDAELRRLHLLKSFGAVAGSITSRYNTLRRRDRRKAIRDPDESSIAQPIAKDLWTQPVVPAENPSQEPEPVDVDDAIPPPRVDPHRERSDTRRVIAEQPDRKGLFRR
jgi:hypothetical protein